MATIDQADIRGSKPHNHDPSGAASDYYRESGHRPVANSGGGFSFVLAPAAADLVQWRTVKIKTVSRKGFTSRAVKSHHC